MQTHQVQRKERDSNMELLRIVAMLMVLSVHANFGAIGFPYTKESVDYPTVTLFRYFWESISIVCVNVFILLSGWYGIRFSKQGLWKILFQALFFSIGMYVLCIITDSATFDWQDLIHAVFLTNDLYWFVISYIGLYILSPVLNIYCAHSEQKSFGVLLLCFFVLQSVWGWFSCEEQFMQGYSIVSFCGLYLLARYLRQYPNKASMLNKKADLCLYLFFSTATALCGYISTRLNINGVPTRLLAYNSPFVILASVYLVLYFSKLSFNNDWINKIAYYCFGVYLLHASNAVYFGWFKPSIRYVWQHSDRIVCAVGITGLLIVFFAAGIMVDYFRNKIWERLVVGRHTEKPQK